MSPGIFSSAPRGLHSRHGNPVHRGLVRRAPRDAETASPPQSNSVIRLMAMSATVLNLNKRLYSSFQIIAQTSAAPC
jgi:hypothetical protein